MHCKPLLQAAVGGGPPSKRGGQESPSPVCKNNLKIKIVIHCMIIQLKIDVKLRFHIHVSNTTHHFS